MPFDTYVAQAVAYELDSQLATGRIEKILQPQRDEIILNISVFRSDDHLEAVTTDTATTAASATTTTVATAAVTTPATPLPKRAKYNLLLSASSAHPRIFISKEKHDSGESAYNFLMVLRKHIAGGRIVKITSVAKERIVRVYIKKHTELGLVRNLCLICEIMGKHSNITLTDTGIDPDETNADILFQDSYEDERIIDAIKRVSFDVSRTRQTLPKMKYHLPDAARGISPIMVEEANTRGGLDAGGLDYINALASEHQYTPTIYMKDAENALDFHVFDLISYIDAGKLHFDTVSSMLEKYFDMKAHGNRMNQKRGDLTRLIDHAQSKHEKKLQKLKYDMQDARKLEEYKLYGDLITANMYMISQGDELVNLPNYYAQMSQEQDISQEIVQVRLDKQLSPAANAQAYYKKYNKSKRAIEVKTEQIKITEDNIDYLEGYRIYIDNADSIQELDKLNDEISEVTGKKSTKNGQQNNSNKGKAGKHGKSTNAQKTGTKSNKKIKNRDLLTYTSSDGHRIWVGRNNQENDYLSLKFAKDTDIWLHTKDIPGSHVILETDDDVLSLDDIEETSLKEAAAIAAYYSKGKLSEGVGVDYVRVKYIKKPTGAKLGKVIFKNNRTVYVTPTIPAE
ncbi:MAG: NFACT family protein [Clostridiales Family XIII bacterium]|jgi:predicted ribosome quality control (RQC) complex YloA/Tae2 family protein|nr:NFACT family protein [Clostridiales Family XIII bacterium]